MGSDPVQRDNAFCLRVGRCGGERGYSTSANNEGGEGQSENVVLGCRTRRPL